MRGARRVGIVLLTGIGDLVHGLPIVNDLKRADLSSYEPKTGRMERIEVSDVLDMVRRARATYGVARRAAR